MQTETYNGWKNYETWNVALWLGNDEGSYLMVRHMARDARKDEYPAGALATMIEAEVKDSAPDLGASMFADLLGAALSEVDWYEIAQNVLSED